MMPWMKITLILISVIWIFVAVGIARDNFRSIKTGRLSIRGFVAVRAKNPQWFWFLFILNSISFIGVGILVFICFFRVLHA